jgi:hypothetical protein
VGRLRVHTRSAGVAAEGVKGCMRVRHRQWRFEDVSPASERVPADKMDWVGIVYCVDVRRISRTSFGRLILRAQASKLSWSLCAAAHVGRTIFLGDSEGWRDRGAAVPFVWSQPVFDLSTMYSPTFVGEDGAGQLLL